MIDKYVLECVICGERASAPTLEESRCLWRNHFANNSGHYMTWVEPKEPPRVVRSKTLYVSESPNHRHPVVYDSRHVAEAAQQEYNNDPVGDAELDRPAEIRILNTSRNSILRSLFISFDTRGLESAMGDWLTPFVAFLLFYVLVLAKAIHQPGNYTNLVALGFASISILCIFVCSCILLVYDGERVLNPVFGVYTSVPLSDEF
jgi:hypothetical protein